MRSKVTRAWAEIDLGALAHNLREIRKLLRPACRIMAVVKADAYGHGAVEVAKAALRAGASWLGVATLDEALALRRSGIKGRILIVGPIDVADLAAAARGRISVTIGSMEFIDALERLGRRLPRAQFHLKVDTGMTRFGVMAADAARAISRLKQARVHLEGCYTHLSSADEPGRGFTEGQLDGFSRVLDVVRRGFPKAAIHAASSAGVFAYPTSHFDIVRIGIAMYGLQPSPHVRSPAALRPVMRLLSRVVRVARVPAGTAVGYGATYRTRAQTSIATVACGYADGYPRLAGIQGEVAIRGRRYPIAGRLSMDYLAADVGNSEVAADDEVELFGVQISADEVASWAHTISYEILTRIGPRVPRVYIRKSTRPSRSSRSSRSP